MQKDYPRCIKKLAAINISLERVKAHLLFFVFFVSFKFSFCYFSFFFYFSDIKTYHLSK